MFRIRLQKSPARQAGGIGGLLALTDHSTLDSQPSAFFYHCDGNGNATCLVDANQNVVARYLYDPFGNTLSGIGSKAAENLYRFSSKEQHRASGLVYYGYRAYVPDFQRWLNRDPFEDLGFQGLALANAPQRVDGNLYVFVDNAPVAKIDAWGLNPTFPGCRKEQKDRLTKALKDMCDKAKKCAKTCTAATEASGGVETVCDKNPTINCVSDDFEFADGTSAKTLCGRFQRGEIYITDHAFKGLSANCDPNVGCVLFHESLHLGGIAGHPPDFTTFAKCMGCGY